MVCYLFIDWSLVCQGGGGSPKMSDAPEIWLTREKGILSPDWFMADARAWVEPIGWVVCCPAIYSVVVSGG